MVLERFAQRAGRAVDGHLLVHLVADPTGRAPVVQPQLPVRPGVAMAQEAAEVGRQSRYRVATRTLEAARTQRLDLGAQPRCHDLVGVDTQHPVVLRGIGRELLLRAVARPVALDHARAAGRRDLARRVGGMRVDHQPLVAEGERVEARADAVRLVAGDDAGGDRGLVHVRIDMATRTLPSLALPGAGATMNTRSGSISPGCSRASWIALARAWPSDSRAAGSTVTFALSADSSAAMRASRRSSAVGGGAAGTRAVPAVASGGGAPGSG